VLRNGKGRFRMLLVLAEVAEGRETGGALG